MNTIPFEMARNVAQQSDFVRTHVGCLITYKGRPVSSGCNSNKTHPMQEKYNKYRNKNHTQNCIPKIHAEIQALAKLKNDEYEPKYDPRKLAVYVYRIRKDQDFGMARPCPSCMQAIKDMGIRNIYYTTDSGYAHEVIR